MPDDSPTALPNLGARMGKSLQPHLPCAAMHCHALRSLNDDPAQLCVEDATLEVLLIHSLLLGLQCAREIPRPCMAAEDAWCIYGAFVPGLFETHDQWEWKARCQIIEFGAIDAAGPAGTHALSCACVSSDLVGRPRSSQASAFAAA